MLVEVVLMAPLQATQGCPGAEALNPVCQAGSLVGSLGGSVIGASATDVLNGLSQWVASGAEWLLAQVGAVLVATTNVDLGASWFSQHYQVMLTLSGVVILPLAVLSVLQAILRQNPGQLVRSFFLHIPLAALLGVVGIQFVVLALSATDALCSFVAGSSGSDVQALLAGMTKALITEAADPSVAAFVVLLVALLVACATFVLWLELLVRAAAVYVAVLFLPLALATLVWPAIAHWSRRLVETLAALILSKFVIVAILSLAAGAVSSGTAGTGDKGAGFASVLAGGALLVLATFTPFALLRLIPLAEAGAIGHLEGARQRATAPLSRLPRTAANHALAEGKGALEAARVAAGSARMMATAAPVGSGGAAVGAAGGGSTGGGSSGGGSSGGGSSGGGDSGPLEAATLENGGLVPRPDGYMQGLPVSDDLKSGAAWDNPPPRGPNPLRVPLSAGREENEDDFPDGFRLMCQPGPSGRTYAIGRDEFGPTVHFVPKSDAAGSPDAGTA
jgi:type IV secretion system protein TrbL